MIVFITIGTQFPFDRLLSAIQQWSVDKPQVSIVAQTGKTQLSLSNIEKYEYLTPTKYNENFSSADLVVGHAGTGTIITAKTFRKPLIIMPRLFELHEHRSEHQIATAEKFKNDDGVYVAENEQSLFTLLNRAGELRSAHSKVSTNRNQLTNFLKLQIQKVKNK